MTDKISANKQIKIELVGKLTEKITRSKSMVMADYSGITHKQLEDFRKKIKKLEAQFVVTKNALIARALKEVHKDVEIPEINNATAILFSTQDEVSALKELVQFFKDVAKGSIKLGFLGSKVLTESEVVALSKLPNMLQLRAQLVGQLQSPIYGLHNALSWNIRKLVWTLDAVKSKKSN